MKKVIDYLKTFIKQDFNFYFYSYTALFLIVFIYLNYKYNLEHKWVMQYFGTYKAYLLGFSFNAVAYFSIAVPKAIFFKESYLKNKFFWIKSIIFLALLSIDGTFFHHIKPIYDSDLLNSEKRYLYNITNNVYPSFIYFIPLLFLKRVFDKNQRDLYGFTFNGFDYKLYSLFLLIMVPLIFWASFQPDFQASYPQFKPWETEPIFGLSRVQLSFFFEFVYGLDFLTIELLFRGALVIGLSSIMGTSVILPMVTTYAFLHFGKPLAETIGSIFGGYILGVIALYSRTIMGGCAIHIGVALLMEVFALLQYYVIQFH